MKLHVENLGVQFGRTNILNGITFSMKEHEVVGLIGPNGCGKTTFLNALSGFVPLESGTITCDDKDITDLPPHARATLGLGRTFQNPGVFREMTLEENFLIALEHAENYPWWWRFDKKIRRHADEKIDEALLKIDLHPYKHSPAGILSGGQLRLLELARMQLSGGRLLLVDEPTAGVAPVMKNLLSKNLRELTHGQKRSMIIVEHDLKFLFGLVSRVIVLVNGEIFLDGPPEKILLNEKLKEIYFGK